MAFDPNQHTYKFSNAQNQPFQVWTAPASRRIFADDAAPTAVASGVSIDAAKQEFEPFQIIISPGAGSLTVSMSTFSPNGGQTFTIEQAGFDNGGGPTGKRITDTLTPITGAVTLSATDNTVLWITVFVPASATAGSVSATLTLNKGGTIVNIPVTLQVWNWVMPKTNHFHGIYESMPNGCTSTIPCLDAWKQVYLDFKMSPEGIGNPAGLYYKGSPSVTWNCSVFSDEPNQACQYSGGCTAARYGLGQGQTWRGTTYSDWTLNGFDNLQELKFYAQNPSRPPTFCGQTLSADTLGPAAYNTEWKKFLTAMSNYMESKTYNGVNMLSKAYWYTFNEPQNYVDYQIASFLCWQGKQAAPKFRTAISEEPKPEITDMANCGCGYDIWIAHVHTFKSPYAQFRMSKYGEEVWIYSLDNDANSAPNAYAPCQGARSTNAGMHYRAISWISASLRATGWGYYLMSSFFNTFTDPLTSQTSVRGKMGAVLLRESWEDYEYIYKANGGYPAACTNNAIDRTIRSIGVCQTSWRNQPDLVKAMRYELGRAIDGLRVDLPYYQVMAPRARGNYYINFGDPTKTANVVWNGNTYQTIGWNPYDPNLGYGWCSQYIGSSTIMLYRNGANGGNAIQESNMYNDYGRFDEFHFALANGVYNVTVALGYYMGNRNDRSYLEYEGIPVFNGTVVSQREFSRVIELTDELLTLGIGQYNQYTMLAYAKIEAVTQVVTSSCKNPPLGPRVSTTCQGETSTFVQPPIPAPGPAPTPTPVVPTPTPVVPTPTPVVPTPTPGVTPTPVVPTPTPVVPPTPTPGVTPTPTPVVPPTPTPGVTPTPVVPPTPTPGVTPTPTPVVPPTPTPGVTPTPTPGVTPTPTPTSVPPPTPTPGESSSGPNIGAIIGGVIGGLLCLLLLLAILGYLWLTKASDGYSEV